MNNSTEAEKWINHLEQKLNEFANPPKGGVTTMPMSIPIGRDEAKVILQLISREKELAQLTDEVIEEIVKNDPNPIEYLSEWTIREKGAKSLRDHLKQNSPQFPPERSTKGQEG